MAGARTLLLNGLAQSDLDMAGHHILNCPDLVAGVGPNNFPAQAHKWINAYNATTGNFAATQPATADVSDWPDPTGHIGQVLSPKTGGGYQWISQATINVKSAPYNAKGDGTTDDTAAIQSALNAAAGGLTVYFPSGNYKITSQLMTPVGRLAMVGDSPWASVLVCDPNAATGPILNLTHSPGSIVSRLGFNGNVFSATSGPVPVRSGIVANNAFSITIDNCVLYALTGVGIEFDFSWDITIRGCWIASCGSFGIKLWFCPKSYVTENIVSSTQDSGIFILNSQTVTVSGNQVYACGPFAYGIGLLDSDNSQITGNLVQQCVIGAMLQTSLTRSQGAQWDLFFSYGYTFTGNTICRNYIGGLQIIASHGFKVTGNVITDNGQGGSDGVHGYTIEPGLMVPPATAGTGYQLGDLVTLDPANGAGSPAKAVVVKVSGAGGITPEGLFPVTMGNYTTFPTNPVNVTGGSGTGAKCHYCNSKILNPGSGYSVGQILRHDAPANGPFYNVARVMVTKVDAGGAVQQYVVIDGGGYNTNTDYPTLSFLGDAYSPPQGPINGVPGVATDPSTFGPDGLDRPDIVSPGVGLVLTPAWSRKYSLLFPSGLGTTFNIETYHNITGGVISGNIISHCKSGCGFLNIGQIAPPWPSGTFSDRSAYMILSGNALVNNRTPLSGGTVGAGGVITLDTSYNVPALTPPYPPSSIFDSQIKNPGGTLIGSGPLNLIL